MIGDLRISGHRLMSRIRAMSKIGATEAGGCNRQALTQADKAGRELFMDWCRAAGCDIRIDAIGNIFARRAGLDESLPVVITGSHLDTQPTGGKYDGIFGVLAGLEVIETLNEAGVSTRHPIEVIVWTNEEGCRFSTAMMGSAVWSGEMALEDAYALSDADGATVLEELQRIGHLGELPASHGPVQAAFEAHIEQGPVLEADEKTIGIVTGVQHMSRHLVHVHGQEAHAGPTPMELRKDPMMALAKFLPGLYEIARDHAPHGRMTFGQVQALPGSSNTVPGLLTMTMDIRHPEEGAYQAMITAAGDKISGACRSFGLDHELDCFWHAPGVEFDELCVGAVRRAVTGLGYAARDMVSGAGHDACNVASVAPTSMIFIPCRDGLSHNEAEHADALHLEAGANVLLHAMAEVAAAQEI